MSSTHLVQISCKSTKNSTKAWKGGGVCQRDEEVMEQGWLEVLHLLLPVLQSFLVTPGLFFIILEAGLNMWTHCRGIQIVGDKHSKLFVSPFLAAKPWEKLTILLWQNFSSGDVEAAAGTGGSDCEEKDWRCNLKENKTFLENGGEVIAKRLGAST